MKSYRADRNEVTHMSTRDPIALEIFSRARTSPGNLRGSSHDENGSLRPALSARRRYKSVRVAREGYIIPRGSRSISSRQGSGGIERH